ncbi:MAG: response regulator transcription factor [Candidatus Caldatribacteriota bacterium]|jgi:DNA-binding response OmpR family regulator|nr:response regulator transcription factor [Atribacterota bacterium]MDD3030820.1 response regulator transcription factor [Atribacterota bacterium]MDD3640613.1 response regulator transcription factor [Atribacterota bacterium]MDD4288326.1 response regulator transcription factor [Atribacterota bacterium]MDD4764282.1 response regulator transcription factor [Atribacterota bacterium]
MKKILIIEDQQSIAELEKDYLEINQFQVEISNNGLTGLQKVFSKNYDLVLLDLMLPDIDGFEVCKKIRGKTNIPILIISARGEDIDKIRGLGLGADDYISKPFSPNELVARVKAHLDRFDRLTGRNKNIRNEIHIKNLSINQASRRVFLDNQEIILTTKEFEILNFLASHPNIVFSKEQLYDHVWGDNSYGDIATIAVYIKKIRDKIEKDPQNPRFIDTLWGSGYRFNA